MIVRRVGTPSTISPTVSLLTESSLLQSSVELGEKLREDVSMLKKLLGSKTRTTATEQMWGMLEAAEVRSTSLPTFTAQDYRVERSWYLNPWHMLYHL